MNRRELLQYMLAGGIVASGLYVPKLISIPSGKVFTGKIYVDVTERWKRDVVLDTWSYVRQAGSIIMEVGNNISMPPFCNILPEHSFIECSYREIIIR